MADPRTVPDRRLRRRADLADALIRQGELLASWFADRDEAQLDAPSALAGWTIADLGRHLIITLRRIGEGFAAPTRQRPLALYRYVRGYREDASGIADAARDDGIGFAAGALAEIVRQVRERMSADWPATVLAPRGPLRSEDLVGSRLIELVVHADDLNRALPGGAAPVAVHPAALRLVSRTLAQLLGEAFPGQTVEVRMPPYAAVQCGTPDDAGSTHTRGTPPNVIEMEPWVFVRLAAGRLTWLEAVTGRLVSASGAHADLTGMVPVLG